jgi:hypothetical protein
MNRKPISCPKELPKDVVYDCFVGPADQAASVFFRRFGRFPEIQYLFGQYVFSPLREQEAKNGVIVPLSEAFKKRSK